MKLSVMVVMAMAASVHGFFRVRCEDRVGLFRSDPIVSPNQISSHVHTFHGPNTISSKADYDTLTNADCSSCAVKTDNSAYWTPALYYVHNGKYYSVNQKGGMLIYYHFYNDTRLATRQGWGHENIDAFPKDFKMLAGSPSRRSAPGPDATQQDKLSYKAIGFNCLRYGAGNEDSLAHHEWRTDDWQTCFSGIRSELWFPSCWDGRSDSPNHKDHMAYPDETKFGKCPSTHPKRLPSLMFETVWDTYAFAGSEFEGGEFVWANGDVTGLGYHGDFQNAWKEGVMEQLMNEPTCYNDGESNGELENCKVFKKEDIRSVAEQFACKTEGEWPEDVGTGTGVRAANSAGSSALTALPGCNEITRGPGKAPAAVTCDTDGKPIDGTTKTPVEKPFNKPVEKPVEKPAEKLVEDLLLNKSKNKGVKVDTPKVKDVVEEKKEESSSKIEDKPVSLAPVEQSTSSTSSNKYLVVVTTTMTRTVTEGEPIPTEWLRRRHVHGKHRRHHNH